MWAFKNCRTYAVVRDLAVWEGEVLQKVYRYRNTSERKGATRNPRSGPERHETANSQPLQTRLQAAPRPSVTENGFRVRGSPLPLKALWPVGTDPKFPSAGPQTQERDSGRLAAERSTGGPRASKERLGSPTRPRGASSFGRPETSLILKEKLLKCSLAAPT